jgi:hypothetical protein
VCRDLIKNYKGLSFSRVPKEEREFWIQRIQRELADVGFKQKHAKVAFEQLMERIWEKRSRHVSGMLAGLKHANLTLASLIAGVGCNRSEEGARSDCGPGMASSKGGAGFLHGVVFT